MVNQILNNMFLMFFFRNIFPVPVGSWKKTQRLRKFPFGTS